jgi:nucleoside-diphosphate-sugar epimerase
VLVAADFTPLVCYNVLFVRALVTGGAGFVGSNLVEALLDGGDQVRVVDCLTDYYDVSQKEGNLDRLAVRDGCEIVLADLREAELAPMLDGIDIVYHQAGQPGVRLSWAEGFAAYDSCNILATQRLLEACRAVPVDRFIFASSSSVYGEAPRYPTLETDLPSPRSPYGVTKLAAEHLCGLYAATWAVPTVSLRYFTVYGPSQRPDMSFHRLCEAALGGEPFPLFGDGTQVRSFTYVGDVVEANRRAAAADVRPGTVVNISGGSSVQLTEVITMLEELAGGPVPVERLPAAAGDVSRTGGSIELAQSLLGWEPKTDVREGLTEQLDWHRSRRPRGPSSGR